MTKVTKHQTIIAIVVVVVILVIFFGVIVNNATAPAQYLVPARVQTPDEIYTAPVGQVVIVKRDVSATVSKHDLEASIIEHEYTPGDDTNAPVVLTTVMITSTETGASEQVSFTSFNEPVVALGEYQITLVNSMADSIQIAVHPLNEL